ncbi:MAG: metal ABC transporter ATP-binding protein [Candidatus Howiella sp.]|jgi:zinc transport system ATP-binding protein
MTQIHECGLRCVSLEKVSVKKGRRTLIRDVSLELHCGEITAVIGANGAGKTTLIRAILGDIGHTGRVCFNDHNGNEVGGIKIGYVPQQLHFDLSSPVSVTDLFASTSGRRPVFFGAGKARRERTVAALRSAGCEKLANRRLGELSGGELQRILLALALDPVPDLLILDEPVSGVDAGGLEQFYDTVSGLRHNYHMAIILISHDLPLVECYADRVVLMGGEVLAYGPPEEVYATEAFRKIFGGRMIRDGR